MAIGPLVERSKSIWLVLLALALITILIASAPFDARTDPNRKAPMSDGDLVTFAASAFPYDGVVPGDATKTDTPFLQADPDGRRFHLSPRGGKLYEDQTYSDRRSLVIVPPTFDPLASGAAIVLFFHGNLATLSAVVAQQHVPQQLIASHFDAALLAPQFAIRALDSSPGRFYEPGFFETYMREAAVHLAARSNGRFSAAEIDALPVVIVAYSGGYLPTAFCLHNSGDTGRIAGVILLDAMFGEEAKFEDWITRHGHDAFFVSAYTNASAPLNRQLEDSIRAKGLPVKTDLPKAIGPGAIVFRATLDVSHDDFVTQAWVADPLRDLLRRVQIKAGRR